MRTKAYLFIPAILALLLAACDWEVPTEEEPIRYTKDGRQMVSLSIPTDDEELTDSGDEASRALTLTLARAGINYYEVVFFDGTDYYRVAGPKGSIL
jgi:hypothetical protein